MRLKPTVKTRLIFLTAACVLSWCAWYNIAVYRWDRAQVVARRQEAEQMAEREFEVAYRRACERRDWANCRAGGLSIRGQW